MDEQSTLLAFACGDSIRENRQFRIYYDKMSTNHRKPFKYIGFYEHQMIVGIGEVLKIAACDLIGGQLIVKKNLGEPLLSEERQRVKDTIINTQVFDIKTHHKFYLVDSFEPTYFYKSIGPLRSKQYLDLSQYAGFNTSLTTSQVASILNGKHW